MRFVSDYTNDGKEESWNPERFVEEKDTDGFMSKEELEIFLEYCRLRDAQFDVCPSQLKKDCLFECYEQFKRMAFVHNGKVILDIDEKKMKAKLIYWGKCVVLLPDKGTNVKNIFLDMLKDFEIVYFEGEAGGIQICAVKNLFDEILIKDESITLLKLKKSIGKSGEKEV